MHRILYFITVLMISFFASAQSIPSQSIVIDGYEKDSVIARMKQAPLHNIEGVWQFVDDGAVIAIERFNPDYIAGTQTNHYRTFSMLIYTPQEDWKGCFQNRKHLP